MIMNSMGDDKELWTLGAIILSNECSFERNSSLNIVLTAKNGRLSSSGRSQQIQSWCCWHSTNGKYKHFSNKINHL